MRKQPATSGAAGAGSGVTSSTPGIGRHAFGLFAQQQVLRIPSPGHPARVAIQPPAALIMVISSLLQCREPPLHRRSAPYRWRRRPRCTSAPLHHCAGVTSIPPRIKRSSHEGYRLFDRRVLVLTHSPGQRCQYISIAIHGYGSPRQCSVQRCAALGGVWCCPQAQVANTATRGPLAPPSA